MGIFGDCGKLDALDTVDIDGNSLDRLIALRTKLANAIDACESNRDLAALSRQYREVIRDIDMLENGDEDGDEIASIILRHRKPASD